MSEIDELVGLTDKWFAEAKRYENYTTTDASEVLARCADELLGVLKRIHERTG
jgi:hypothetical protein